MKNLKVLFIDDLDENIENARAFVAIWNNNEAREVLLNNRDEKSPGKSPCYPKWLLLQEFPKGIPDCQIEPTFARNGEEALSILSSNNFDIVLSDVFFHFLDQETPMAIRSQIFDILGDHTRAYMDKVDQWLTGEQTPPTGVLIVEEVLRRYAPYTAISLNSSVYHHNKIAEPIYSWARANHIKYCDDATHLLREIFNDDDDAGYEVFFDMDHSKDVPGGKGWTHPFLSALKIKLEYYNGKA